MLITCPELSIVPVVPIADWGLSATGHKRSIEFTSSEVLSNVTQIWISGERMACEAAKVPALLTEAGWSVSVERIERRTIDAPMVREQWSSDEYIRECLAIRVKRKLTNPDAIDSLTDLFILRGPPGFIHSDNGSEFIAHAVRERIAAVGALTAHIEPGSPRETDIAKASMAGPAARFSTTCAKHKS